MESIVVGFDGSPPASVALDWAADRASHRASRLEVLRVDSRIVMRESESRDLDRAARRVRDRAPHTEVSTRIIGGRVPSALVEAAREADMLVVGTYRGRPFRNAVTGFTSLRTTARSHVPTVVVPEDWNAADGPVLVGIDDDDSSTAAVEFAACEAESAGVELVAVHAWQMPVPTMEGPVALLSSPIEVRGGHRRILEDACREVSERHPDVAVRRILVRDNPISALLARAPGCRMVVLGTHHRGILEGTLLGSTAQDTMPALPIPVCVVPTVNADVAVAVPV